MPTEIKTWTDRSSRTNSSGNSSIATVSCNSMRVLQDNPRWRQEVKRGRDATTPFSATLNRYRSDDRFSLACMVVYKNTNGIPINTENKSVYGGWMRFTSCTDPTTYSLTEANNQALKHFVQKARGVQRSIQGGVFIGELREALSMIRNPAKGFRRRLDVYLQDAKKRSEKAVKTTRLSQTVARSKNSRKSSKTISPKDRIRSARNLRAQQARMLRDERKRSVKRALADSWLEASFGWLPLLSDVDSGAKALARLNYLMYQPLEEVTARGRQDIILDQTGGSGTSGTATWAHDNRTRIELTVQYKAGIKTAAPHARPFAEFGLMPSDFLPTAWELIPWSFVADYFTNIGDIIEGYSFNRADVAWCARTTRRMSTKTCINVRATPNAQPKDEVVFIYFRPGNPIWERKEVIRSKYDGTFVPSFQFEIPGMGVKWINLAALSANCINVSKSIKGLF